MLISIITINYNNLQGLKSTMNSVFEQSYKDVEYIIIDGSSTDGSKDFIESKKESLYYWVSEKDGGIYDAMNKGIEKATGDYFLFLNSGDWLVDNFVIEKFVNFKPVEDIVYGDHFVDLNKKTLRKYMPKKMTIGTALTSTINHQSIFYSFRVFINNRYSLDHEILADWVLTNNAIIFNENTTRYIDLVICYYDINGVSSDFILRHLERNRYLKDHFDPLFLNLLKDYKRLHKKHETLQRKSLVKAVLWIHQLKVQLSHYFKK
ncbi:glycosyltransferase [Psychroserpens burtonensis]|uniref:Glycosyltransferase n=1 Tax=Psychroserpens burtonensis TaxID=49278 RepID=A0A5C7B5S5_9FLAO|nr:glycosyltransferase family 2 protein [Psychroserpens burtonensis]TXE17125.1 glycosyltransferase [Psychroserpens burtonensis]